ncbi:MAG: hypothetical protein QME64_05070, partial [bacterium]|nr:hypothetical protein [bacterium]
IFIFILIAIAVAIFAFYRSLKRHEEWQQFAANHGFLYSKNDTLSLPDYYSEYHLFQQGHSRKAYHICQGRENNLKLLAFDYKYTTGSGKNQHTHYFTPLITESNLVFKPLLIRPEGLFDKIGAAIGFDDIDFESAEFSKKYYVKCADKKFAYDIIHARMMEFLLQCKNMFIEIRGDTLVFHHGKLLSISEMELLLLAAQKFIDLTPEYVRQEITRKTISTGL